MRRSTRSKAVSMTSCLQRLLRRSPNEYRPRWRRLQDVPKVAAAATHLCTKNDMPTEVVSPALVAPLVLEAAAAAAWVL